jgi:hypothetical protein
MALTIEKELLLKGKEFDKLYERERAHFEAKLRDAYGFVNRNVPIGATARQDDVANVLGVVFRYDTLLRNYQQENHATGVRWVIAFAEYVCEKAWDRRLPLAPPAARRPT